MFNTCDRCLKIGNKCNHSDYAALKPICVNEVRRKNGADTIMPFCDPAALLKEEKDINQMSESRDVKGVRMNAPRDGRGRKQR